MAKSQSATWNREDRDLLIELKTTLVAVQIDIKEIKDGTASKLRDLENEKLSRADAVRVQSANEDRLNKIETRLDEHGKALESLQESRVQFRTQVQTWLIAGGILFAIVQIILAAVIRHFFN